MGTASEALPQAVPNSFADFMNEANVDFVITHPEGYELDPKFVRGAKVEYDQWKRLRVPTLSMRRTGLVRV